MRYTVIEAAKIVGKSRQTIYRHIEKKPITVEKDNDDNVYIEASELLRVYGDNINFDAVNSHIDSTKSDKVLQSATKNVTKVDLKVFEEKLHSADKQIEMLETRMRSEREMLEDQIATMKESLKKSQEIQSKTVALLEDKTTSSGAGGFQAMINTLEQRIEKQEQVTKEQISEAEKAVQEEQKRTEQAVSEKQDYQKSTRLLYATTGLLILILIAGIILYNQGIIDIIPAR